MRGSYGVQLVVVVEVGLLRTILGVIWRVHLHAPPSLPMFSCETTTIDTIAQSSNNAQLLRCEGGIRAAPNDVI